MLNAGDSVQYIRIEKAYLSPDSSATMQSHIPDSIYYGNITVTLTDLNTKAAYPLQKVDGDTLGLQRDSGLFAQRPNFLYRLKGHLTPSHAYQLTMLNNENGKTTTAKTVLVNDFSVQIPNTTVPVGFFTASNFKTNFIWRSAINGKVYGLDIRIHYESMLKTDTTRKDNRYVDWDVFSDENSTGTAGNESMVRTVDGRSFYDFMENHFTNVSGLSDSVRRIQYLEFKYSVGGLEFYTYTEINKAGLGLTYGSAKPAYTNISGGLGLFSSRFNKEVSPVYIDPRMQDTLACSPITNNLNFLNQLNVTCH